MHWARLEYLQGGSEVSCNYCSVKISDPFYLYEYKWGLRCCSSCFVIVFISEEVEGDMTLCEICQNPIVFKDLSEWDGKVHNVKICEACSDRLAAEKEASLKRMQELVK